MECLLPPPNMRGQHVESCQSSGLESLNVAGARNWDWLVVGGLGGGAAVFWLIVSSACTNCWTGSIVLVDGCAETGGDCCRVGGCWKFVIVPSASSCTYA